MAIYNVSIGDNLVTVMSGLVAGDVVNLIDIGTYNVSGNILTDGVELHGVLGAVIEAGLNDLFVGIVNSFILTGNIIINSGNIDIEADSIRFQCKELNTHAVLTGGSVNFDVPIVHADLDTSGQVTYQAYLQDGLISHRAGADSLPATFIIQFLQSGGIETLDDKCFIDIYISGVVAALGNPMLVLNRTIGTATIGNCEAGNSVIIDVVSSMALKLSDNPPEITLNDDDSQCIISGNASATLILRHNSPLGDNYFILQDFRVTTVGVCIEAPDDDQVNPLYVNVSAGVTMASDGNLISDSVFLLKHSAPVSWGAIAGDIADQTDLWTELTSKVRWLDKWIGGLYAANDMVIDGEYTMIANKITVDRPAPQPIGAEIYMYQGTITPTLVSAKQLIIGIRITDSIQTVFFSGYRIYTQIGSLYDVRWVEDPLGTPVFHQLELFEATIDGWNEISIPQVIIRAGSTFDLLVRITAPDDSPVDTVANYNYTKPNNNGVPSSGVILHSAKDSNLFNIHYTDSDGTDRTSLIQGLSVGDIIIGASTEWTVQVNTNRGSYAEVAVAPALQGGSTGVQAFTFRVTQGQDINYGRDDNYWLSSAIIQGLYIADGAYAGIVPDDNAYGVDMLLQDIEISDDWDLVAFSGGVAGGSSGGEGVSVHNELTGRDVADTHPVSSITGLQTELDSKEDDLGIPLGNGYFLRGLANGDRYWSQVAVGDMSKSVYDQNDSGVVDDSELLAGQLPSVYNQSAHLLRIDNPHSVTALQVGAEPANSNIQLHISRTDIHFIINDLSSTNSIAWSASKITVELAGKEPANSNIQDHIEDVTTNPHSVTAAQVGAEPADSNIQSHIARTDIHFIINDLSTANNVAWSANKITSELAGKEPMFTKNSAFNKNFGTSGTTVAYGNHLHTGIYEPANSNIQNHIADSSIHLSTDERAAIDNSPSLPTSLNPFATQDDLASGGFGDMLKSVYDQNSNSIVDNSEQLGGELPAFYNQNAHVAETNNPHSVTASQVGAESANSNIQTHIARTDIHFIINDLSSLNSVAWSANKITNELAGKEPVFSKNTAFNRNFGTTGTTIAYGNHLHGGVYEPANSNIQIHISDGAIHFIINDSSTANNVAWSADKISTAISDAAIDPAGDHRQVQFNDNGAWGADPDFYYWKVGVGQGLLIADKLRASNADISGSYDGIATLDADGDLKKSPRTIADLENQLTPPAGADREIQFNNNGVFGGHNAFYYEDSFFKLHVPKVAISSMNAGSELEPIISIDPNGDINKQDKSVSDIIALIPSATPPAGSNTEIQFNNNGSFGANSLLYYDNLNNRLYSEKFRVTNAYASAVTDSIVTTSSAGDLNISNINVGSVAKQPIYISKTGNNVNTVTITGAELDPLNDDILKLTVWVVIQISASASLARELLAKFNISLTAGSIDRSVHLSNPGTIIGDKYVAQMVYYTASPKDFTTIEVVCETYDGIATNCSILQVNVEAVPV